MSESLPVRIDKEHYKKLAEIRKVDGVSIAESIRRAVDEYYAKWKDEQERERKD